MGALTIGAVTIGALTIGATASADAAAAEPAMFLPRRPANPPLPAAELRGTSGATGATPPPGAAALLLITNKDMASEGTSPVPAPAVVDRPTPAPLLELALAEGRRTAICGAVSRVGGIESRPMPGATTSAGASSAWSFPPPLRLRRWLRRVLGRSGRSTGISDGRGARALFGWLCWLTSLAMWESGCDGVGPRAVCEVSAAGDLPLPRVDPVAAATAALVALLLFVLFARRFSGGMTTPPTFAFVAADIAKS